MSLVSFLVVRRSRFGSTRKLGSGRYQASYKREGEVHLAPTTYRTKPEAEAWLTLQSASMVRGDWVDPNAGRVTFAELAQSWLESNPSKRPNTRATDEAALRHLKPLADKPIRSISQPQVQALVNSWKGAPRTVKRRYGVLASIFNYAVAADLLARTPCRNINLPQATTTKRRNLTPYEISAIAEATDPRYRPMVWLGAMLGLRWEEVTALRVGSIDLLRRTVTVSETSIRDGKGRQLSSGPKSKASARTIALPACLGEILSAHLAERGMTGADLDRLVFEAPTGGLVKYANWRSRVWLPAVDAAKVPDAGFHDLRRANATQMVVGGVDVKTAQERLGHSDPRLTLAVYANSVREADRAAAEMLGDRFLRPKRDTDAASGSSLAQ